MLFTNRPSPYRFFGTATLISLFIVFCFNWYIWGLGSERRFFDPFSESRCSSETIITNGLVASISAEAPTATTIYLAPSLSASTVTVEHPILVTQSPVTVTVTSTTHTSSPTAIPEKIWYKLGPKGLSEDAKGWTDSCLAKNPTFRHEFLTDASGDYYVKEYFSHRPDIVDTYLRLPIPILKADLLRYLILYAEGGMWSDLDVSCEEVTIHNWIPEEYREGTGLVVGLEFDWKWEDDDFLHSQFASWTIMAKPGSPHMLQVIEDILEGMKSKAEENSVPISGLTTQMVGEVVDATGPKRMTRSIVKSMEAVLGKTVDDRNISGLYEPKLIGDVLVLPGNAFAASQSGYPKDQGPMLVTHHYAGTWKNDHGGEMA